ncbi:hypothetical protein IFM89_004198 [Coptis chinensis]|uniref:Uncharacterized protein n=1 Tax=Coptis chinensis TaxID=261450 RepID=A0A835LQG3_9MAGN|nr:hypothetical protein IFM89_004198 [Coptis chinensis]
MPQKRATVSKAVMVNEGSTSQARTRRSASRLIEEVEEINEEEVSLKALLRRLEDLEKQNKILMAENKVVREENEKRAEDALYEKNGEASSSGTPVVRKSHVEEMRKSHHEEVQSVAKPTPKIVQKEEVKAPITKEMVQEMMQRQFGNQLLEKVSALICKLADDVSQNPLKKDIERVSLPPKFKNPKFNQADRPLVRLVDQVHHTGLAHSQITLATCIDPSKVKVSIKYGLCEILDRKVVKPELAPKAGDFIFSISQLVTMFPVGIVEPVYSNMPQWEESVLDVRARYAMVISAITEKYHIHLKSCYLLRMAKELWFQFLLSWRTPLLMK